MLNLESLTVPCIKKTWNSGKQDRPLRGRRYRFDVVHV